jgi:hypothetical protein
MKKLVAFLSLFGSLGTLLCCALPALFVALGLGGAFAGLMGALPQLVWVSLHKGMVFGFAGGMIIVGGLLQWRARHEPCPVDPEQAMACRRARLWSVGIYWSSVMLYAIGAFFAFLLPAFQHA